MSLRAVHPTGHLQVLLCFSYLVVSLTLAANKPLQHIDFGTQLSFHGPNLTMLFAFGQLCLHFSEIYASPELSLPGSQGVKQRHEDKKHLLVLQEVDLMQHQLQKFSCELLSRHAQRVATKAQQIWGRSK